MFGRSPLLLLALGLLSALPTTACQSGAAVGCRDDSCPVGQRCGLADCEGITPPEVSTTDLGRFTSSALTPSGKLVVATYDEAGGNLVVGRQHDDGSLGLEIVDGWALSGRDVIDTNSGQGTDLTITDDATHLVWFDASEGALRYAFQTTGDPSWHAELVDGGDGNIRGAHPCVAVKEGVVHVAYRDETAHALRYARRELDGTWKPRTIDVCAGELGCDAASPDEDFGEWSDITVIGQMPRIAFYDRKRGDLKMATRRPTGQWETNTLDGGDPQTGEDTGDVGRFVSLALTASRQPGLAYFDATRGALRYLVPGSSPVVVDAGLYTDQLTGVTRNHAVGQFVQLRYGLDDRAVMLYLDAGGLAIKRAVVSSGNVVSVTRENALAPGVFIAFDIVGRDRLVGAYGAWLPGNAPHTKLATFDLPLESP